MKTITIFLILMSISFSNLAQPVKPVLKKNKATDSVIFKTLEDSASYILGFDIGQNVLKNYAGLNPDILNKAVKDAMLLNKSQLEKAPTAMVINTYVMKQQQKKAIAEKKIGAKFLEENKKRKDVFTRPSGLQYEIITLGKGPKPTLTDMVKMNYTGTLLNGKEFDASARTGKPAEFSVGGVLAGWTEVLQLMPVGSKFKVYLPSDLAYGDFGGGDEIGPGATLIFVIELLAIIDTK